MTGRTIAVALALVVAAPTTAHASSRWRDHWRGSLDAGWLAHPVAPAQTLSTGDGPAFVAFDAATRTLYVSNGMEDSVGVFDVSRCTAPGGPAAAIRWPR